MEGSGSGRWRICGLGLALLLAACQTIPDISAWDRATHELGMAVVDGFQSTAGVNSDIAAQLRALDEPDFAGRAERYADAAQILSVRAGDYEKLFGAMADYSASLAAIAKASENSTTNVDAVAGSLNQLVTSLGGTALAGPGFDLFKLLASEVVKVKAAQDFAHAVQAADPVVGGVCDLLLKDMAAARRVLETKEEPIRAAMSEPFTKRLDYRRALERRREALQGAVKDAAASTSLSALPQASELQKVDQLLRDTDAWYGPWKQDLDKALATRAKADQLLAQTARATEAWRSSHASLVQAIRERRAPESARLAALAIRIKELAAEIRKGT